MSNLPEEIIQLILSYAPDFRDNLRSCHKEMEKYRPKYYKKVTGGFIYYPDNVNIPPVGIGTHPSWDNFHHSNNDEITFLQKNLHLRRIHGTESPIYRKLKLHAIEITPEKETTINFMRDYHMRIKSYRNINLYYGWDRRQDVTKPIYYKNPSWKIKEYPIQWYLYSNEFKPDYY